MIRRLPAKELVKKTPRKGPRRQGNRLERAVKDVRDILASPRPGDWRGAKPSAFVALYAVLHEKVYGVFPDEVADDFQPALSSARRCLEKSFGGNGEAMLEFMRWSWQKERRSFNKAPEKDFRMGWRYQFSTKMVTNYRVATQA